MKKIVFVFSLLILASFPLNASEMPSLSSLANDPKYTRLVSMLEKAQKSYASVNDYKAVFQKQERSGAVMGEKETIFLKFEKPFKIFMGWMNTHKKGLQVLYERGRHDGKLAIHKPGLMLGLMPVVFLEQDSPWVREGSESYDIEDAGIGTFLEDLSEAVVKGAEENKLQVTESAGETLDITFSGSKEGEGFFAYRVLVHFDPKTALCDRMELFDWKNEAMGIYAYENLELNVGTNDKEFEKFAMKRLHRLYLPPVKPAAASQNFSGRNPRATPKAG